MKEEILFTMKTEGWSNEMPATLITYNSGKSDLHCQTGGHHIRSVKKAEKILAARGLRLTGREIHLMTGIYYPLEFIKD